MAVERKRPSFRRLVELFFQYIDRKSDLTGALLEELEGIRRGSQGSFQTACLTLAVGTESLAKMLLARESLPRTDERLLRSLLDYVDKWPDDNSSPDSFSKSNALKGRAKRVVRGLAKVSAADTMYAWATRTKTSHKLIDSWKRLRNPKAHGGTVQEEQSGYDSSYSVVELMHRIVASSVGFDGEILPTSRRGWGTAG